MRGIVYRTKPGGILRNLVLFQAIATQFLRKTNMNLTKPQLFALGAVLAVLVTVTHSQHFATQLHLPPATWTAFFLGGFYLRRLSFLAAGLLLVATIDFVAITWGGVTEATFVPAYLFMVPAYGVLWWAGRRFAGLYAPRWSALPYFVLSLTSILVAELFASGSFYLLMNPQGGITPMGLWITLVTWLPETLQSFFFWMVPAVLLQGVITLLRLRSHPESYVQK